MLSRLASGAEESSSILIVVSSPRDTLAARSLVSLLLNKSGSGDNIVLVTTGPSPPRGFDKTSFSQVIDLSDSLGWVSGSQLILPSCPGDQSVVIDSLTDLLPMMAPDLVCITLLFPCYPFFLQSYNNELHFIIR